MEQAHQLAALHMPSHAATKLKVRAGAAEAVAAAIKAVITLENAQARLAERQTPD